MLGLALAFFLVRIGVGVDVRIVEVVAGVLVIVMVGCRLLVVGCCCLWLSVVVVCCVFE